MQVEGHVSISFLLSPEAGIGALKYANSWAQVESDSGTVLPATPLRVRHVHACVHAHTPDGLRRHLQGLPHALM